MTDPKFLKVSLWNGKDLKGTWHVTIKIDGVRALWVADEPQAGGDGCFCTHHPDDPAHGSWCYVPGGHWESRAGKPLYNIPAPQYSIQHGNEFWWPGDNCELYLGNLADSVRACRTKHLKPDTPRITHEHLYSLNPIDPRLDLGLVENPTAAWITSKLATVNGQGYEGLVLRQGDKWVKVKPHDTYDVRVLSIHEGTGKHAGRLGYVTTHMGDVGTGWSDAERTSWWHQRHRMPGTTIEVECMQLTPDGKFRHARFIRERFDKIAAK